MVVLLGEVCVGDVVMFGICLEYLYLDVVGVLWGVVMYIEFLGDVVYLYVDCEVVFDGFVLCVLEFIKFVYGSVIMLVVDVMYCYLFDVEGCVLLCL